MSSGERFSKWSSDMWPLRSTLLGVVPKAFRTHDDAQRIFKRPWDTLPFFQEVLTSRVNKPHIGNTANIHPTAIIEGDVHLGREVIIRPYAHIVGPVYIGDQVEIGDHSLIRSSIVGKRSVVGAFSEIVRSVIGHHTTTHHSFVGDSIVSPYVEITAGDVLTGYNLRGKHVSELFQGRMEQVGGKLGALVGTYTSIGMHCGVLPGIKIGEHCTIYPGTIVSKDIQDGRIAKSESAITIYPAQ